VADRLTFATLTGAWRLDRVGGMGDADIRAKTWTRFEFDRLVEAEILGPEDRIELVTLGPDEGVSPLALAEVAITIGDLLP
jgi:hypothetical protein